MNLVVVVPYGDDGGDRQRNWGYAQRFWMGLGLPVVVGSSPEGEPFDVTKARNAAVAGMYERFPEWEAALMTDADAVLGSHDQALLALSMAYGRNTYVVAHDELRYLGQNQTREVLDGRHPECAKINGLRTWETTFAFTREMWETIGGFDPRFRGFGHQVEAFFHAATTLFGDGGRIHGPCIHLWHAYSADEEHRYLTDNRGLVERYWAASGDRGAMLTLLGEYAAPA